MKIKGLAILMVAGLFSGAVFADTSSPVGQHSHSMQFLSIDARTINGSLNPDKNSLCKARYGQYLGQEVQASYTYIPHKLQTAEVSTSEGSMTLAPEGVSGQKDFVAQGTPNGMAGESMPAFLDVKLNQWRFQMNMPGDVANDYYCVVVAAG